MRGQLQLNRSSSLLCQYTLPVSLLLLNCRRGTQSWSCVLRWLGFQSLLLKRGKTPVPELRLSGFFCCLIWLTLGIYYKGGSIRENTKGSATTKCLLSGCWTSLRSAFKATLRFESWPCHVTSSHSHSVAAPAASQTPPCSSSSALIHLHMLSASLSEFTRQRGPPN